MADRTRQTGGRSRGAFAFDASLEMGSGSVELERALLDAYRVSAGDVLAELWEADVERLCGERWKPRPRSRVTRAGWCGCQIVLGGVRMSLRRPRVRSTQGREIELPTFKAASRRDLLDDAAVEDITASVTTGTFPPNRHRRDAIGADFVEGLAGRMSAIQAMPRARFEPGLLIASVDFPDQTFLGAVGIDGGGQRQLAGLRAGSPVCAANVSGFLDDLVIKHRQSAPPEVFFVGEEPVIHTALHDQFGASALLQRSPHEKRRRVLGLLPPSFQPAVLERMLDAFAEPGLERAERALRAVAKSLQREHPDAAQALSEGLEETLTLHRLSAGSRKRPRKRARSPQPNA